MKTFSSLRHPARTHNLTEEGVADFISLVSEAAEMQAEDLEIHAPDKKDVAVRLRRLGKPPKARTIPAERACRLVESALALCDLSEARTDEKPIPDLPITLPENVLSLRMLPLMNGCGGIWLHVRLIYRYQPLPVMDVGELGFTREQACDIHTMRNTTSGLNIVAGFTGSGLTTTVRTALSRHLALKDKQLAIGVIENSLPIASFPGALSFTAPYASNGEVQARATEIALREAALHACSIISIDNFLAEQNIALALTEAAEGRQVWIQLAAPDIVSVVGKRGGKWLDASASPLLVTGIVAQRLVRTLCPHCKIPMQESALPEASMTPWTERFGDLAWGLFTANQEGCDHPDCIQGHAGRTVVAETAVPDEKFMDLILKGARDEAIDYWQAELGGISILEHAVAKALAGIIDPLEIEFRFGSSIEGIPHHRLERIREIVSEYGVA